MCLDNLVFWCLKQRPPLPHPNPSPESTLTISVHYCDRGPSTQFHMPRVFNHCWGWHLIFTVYFCACPSVTDKMLLLVQLMCWNGECRCQVVCAILYLRNSWPRKWAWNQEKDFSVVLPQVGQNWKLLSDDRGQQAIWPCLGAVWKNTHVAFSYFVVHRPLEFTRHIYIISFCLLSTCCVPGIVLGTVETAGSKTDPALLTWSH